MKLRAICEDYYIDELDNSRIIYDQEDSNTPLVVATNTNYAAVAEIKFTNDYYDNHTHNHEFLDILQELIKSINSDSIKFDNPPQEIINDLLADGVMKKVDDNLYEVNLRQRLQSRIEIANGYIAQGPTESGVGDLEKLETAGIDNETIDKLDKIYDEQVSLAQINYIDFNTLYNIIGLVYQGTRIHGQYFDGQPWPNLQKLMMVAYQAADKSINSPSGTYLYFGQFQGFVHMLMNAISFYMNNLDDKWLEGQFALSRLVNVMASIADEEHAYTIPHSVLDNLQHYKETQMADQNWDDLNTLLKAYRK